MRRVSIRALQNKQVLLSLNRFFYVLKPVDADAEGDLRAATPDEPVRVGYKIMSKIEKEAIQHFEVFEEQDWLVNTDESNKFVSFYSLSEVIASQSNRFPQAKHQHRSGKKVCDLKKACFNQV